MSHQRPARPPHWLRVDASGVVAGVSTAWNDFVGSRLVGCLTETAHGERFATLGGAAASLYAQLFEDARQLRPASFDIWASAPEAATKVELSVSRREGEVEIGLQPLFERPREDALRFFDPSASRGDDGIRACGFCGRLYAFRWTEAETALRQLQVDRHAPLQPRLKPDVCLDCERQLQGAGGLLAAG